MEHRPFRRLIVLPVMILFACSEVPPTADEGADIVGIVRVEPAVMTEAEVDEPPERLWSPPLEYPQSLYDSGTEGMLLLGAVIGADGTVEEGSIEVMSADKRRICSRGIAAAGGEQV